MQTKQLSQRQRKEHARRKAMGVAIIERPLRFVAERTDTFVPNKSGVGTRRLSIYTKMARRYAQEGNGAGVRHIARTVL